VGETVFDPFCGSGTTLVEALILKRHALGLDANPIACLISRAKTVRLTSKETEALRRLEEPLSGLAARFVSRQVSLFDDHDNIVLPDSDKIRFWFDPHVIIELAHIKALCVDLPAEACRTLALAAFSSIIVAVSKQDSDTRYVRREKQIQRGETIRRFQRALNSSIERAVEFSDLVEERFQCRVIQGDVLAPPADVAHADLIVCSPPYPNAYSYHLYHMTRLIWLDADPSVFKKVEIGSHRKYSRRGPSGATADTFRDEMKVVLDWFRKILSARGYCCFVIGDSILNGIVVHNNELLSQVAESAGFQVVADISRHLDDTKKSFNPRIGKIRHEHVLILKNKGSKND
jgi:site-specific DNA-methyltransferase (cytosine-N4-specific)